MAYTERYVTSAAAGGGDGSSGSPWTLEEAFSNAAAGDRVNIQKQTSPGYELTSPGNAATPAGTQSAPIVWRGYNSTIGDLDSVGRDTPANGSALITTDMPLITISSTLVPASYNIFMNINFECSLGDQAVEDTASDFVTLYQCRVYHTGSAGNVRPVNLDNQATLIMCDIETTGADTDDVVSIDHGSIVLACKITGSDTAERLLTITSGQVIGNVFINGGLGIRLEQYAGAFGPNSLIMNNTAYNLGSDFLETPALTQNSPIIVINNHVTDCGRFFNNLNGSESPPVLGYCTMLNNRTRDNTSADIGIGDSFVVGEVTTDTGGAATDYTDAASDDFSLISGAPGENAGISVG